MPQYLSPGVYIQEVEAGSRPIEGVGTAVAAFVGLADDGPFNTPTLVTNWSQFTGTFGGFVEGCYLAHAVYGFFLNGGGSCYVVRVGGDGQAPSARAEMPSAQARERAAYRVSALAEGAEGDAITVEVSDASEPSEENFKLTVARRGAEPEVYDNVTTKRGRQNVVTAVRQSKLIRLEEVATGGELAPARGQVTLAGGASVPKLRVTPDDFAGSPADRTGFGGLETIEEITMLAAPDLMAMHQRGVLDMDGVQAVQDKMIAHCELMADRMAILDAPSGLSAQQVREWRVERARYDSRYAALYWPWLKIWDPARGEAVAIPPSGHMAGIWARNDDTRGVHKAPANEVVRGALDLELLITKGEHDLLNDRGVNCIRAFPGRGIRVWGARTLSSDPAWRYVNVRRLFNYVEESILGGTQWVVFEPNDLALWGRVRRTVGAFLLRVWRDGALFGATPQEAFYVKCDSETNPPEAIDAGQLTIEIGIAPVKPAEFVVFRIAQLSAGGSVSE